MKNCKKCNKKFNYKEQIYEGMCLNCYYLYIMKKIEHLGEKQPKPENRLKVWFSNMNWGKKKTKK